MSSTMPTQGSSAPNDTSSSQAQPTSPSARQSRIRQSASESSTPINFARPLFSHPQGDAENADYFDSSSGVDATDEADWRDEPEPSMSGSDRRALHASFYSDHLSRPSTPLKIRRRGIINDKKLTISVGASSSKSSSGRRVASDSATSASSELPARPAAAARALSHQSTKRAVDSSGSSMSMLSPRSGPASPRKNSPKEEGSSPGGGIRRYMPFTPVKKSPLADNTHSPTAASTSPGSGSMPSSAAGSSNSGRSDKPLISGPRYGFNPEFQLGASGSKSSGSKLSPNTSSPTSVRQGVSPVKPSPTYSGSHAGGVKSMLYSNQRNPSLPLSPRAPMHLQRSPGAAASKQQSPPRTPRTPKIPRTPRTPLTARLPNTPLSARPGIHTAGSYQGVLLTTITRAPSDPRVPTEGPLAESSTQAAARKGRNRSATIGADIRGFVRGGAAEIVPRLELRVLERQRQSQLYSLDTKHVETDDKRAKRHSVAAVQPAQARGSAPAGDDGENSDADDASPRSSSFARSAALSKLTGKRASTASARAVRRTSEAPSVGSRMGYRPFYKERRLTAATTASRVSGVSGVSDRSRRSARSNLSRRVSMPVATVASLKSSRPSLTGRRLSLAPSSMRGRRDSSMQPDHSDSDEEPDLLAELNDHVNNVADAKRWILGYRTQYDVTGPGAMGRDVDDGRAVSAMRRPTYAASVFQQARLMEAERQAGAALVSSSALDVANASAANLHAPGTPFPFGLPPRTPGFPKTPLTAFPTDAQLAGEADTDGPHVLVAPEEPTWSDKTKYWLKAPFRFVARQVDPKYVLSMMDPREIIFPITIRKVALWIVYGGVITMLVLLDHYYHWWAKFDHAVHGKNLAIMGVLYGFEPAMILVIMLVARVPDARVVPDRTVLVPRARDSTDGESDADSRTSTSSDESVDDAQLAMQMHSTILEEEHTESEEEQGQDNESGIIDRDGHAAVRRASGLLKPPMRRMSTRFTVNTGGSAGGAERRGSEGTTASGLAVPRTPMFDPRNRRSTIILHEPLNVGGVVDDNGSRRPSAASVQHQIALARSVSRDSRRASYFSIVAAAAGSRLGATTPSPACEAGGDGDMNEKQDDELVVTKSASSGDVEDEKKAAQLSGVKGDDEVRVAMDGVSHPSLTESTGLIIPCHNADVEVLKAVLFAALVHFEPWQIFIVDNGNTESPPTDMEGAIRSQPMFSRVNYIWLPVGNKNIAQFVGAKAAAKLDLDYVLTIDDDVIIPANFAAPMHIISPTVTAVCYPITAVDHKGDRPLFVGWQDVEYKMSALAKMAESKLCGVLFPHGAASFWRRETMIEVLRRHDLIYFADDVKMGLELQALGQRMGIDASISFETVAPETFLGPPVNGTGNYYHQRVRSWEMARHTLYWQFSKRFLFSLNGARTPVVIGWQKFTQFYNSTTNFIDWIRLPMFVLLGGSGQFWLRSFAFIIFLPVLPLLPYRFIKTRNRPDLHPHMLDMLTFGVYKLLYSVVCILGGLRSMLVFFPNHSHKPNLIEMEKKGDKRCIWLRDDFMANSGGQGDLRDEPQQILVDEEVLEAEEVDVQERDSALVAALPENAPHAQEMQEVAVVNVALPSRSREELPTVHENH